MLRSKFSFFSILLFFQFALFVYIYIIYIYIFFSPVTVEPTRFPLLPNVEAISPEQLSYDFSTLKALLRSMIGGDTFTAGPDISAPSMKFTPSNHPHNLTHSEYLQR